MGLDTLALGLGPFWFGWVFFDLDLLRGVSL